MPNAYEINPGMIQALAQVTPDNITGFLMSNPEFAPEHLQKSFIKNIKGAFKLIGGDFAVGVVLNLVLTRTIPSVLILPSYARIPLRLAVFCLPFAVTYPNIAKHY